VEGRQHLHRRRGSADPGVIAFGNHYSVPDRHTSQHSNPLSNAYAAGLADQHDAGDPNLDPLADGDPGDAHRDLDAVPDSDASHVNPHDHTPPDVYANVDAELLNTSN